jgi:hypothetical protein
MACAEATKMVHFWCWGKSKSAGTETSGSGDSDDNLKIRTIKFECREQKKSEFEKKVDSASLFLVSTIIRFFQIEAVIDS